MVGMVYGKDGFKLGVKECGGVMDDESG